MTSCRIRSFIFQRRDVLKILVYLCYIKLPLLSIFVFSQLVEFSTSYSITIVPVFKPVLFNRGDENSFYKFSIVVVDKKFLFIIYYPVGPDIDLFIYSGALGDRQQQKQHRISYRIWETPTKK